MLISKKTRIIIINKSPTKSRKRMPPHNVIKNTFSDFLILNLIDNKPAKKLRNEINAPKRTDEKSLIEIFSVKNRIAKTRIVEIEIVRAR